MTPQKIVFDTDPGIDDAMALLFAHYSPAIDLLGITTVMGNGSIETTTRNALYVCERFNIPAPVYQGAASPLLVPVDAPPAFIHGDDGLGNIHADSPRRQTNNTSAAQFIVDTVLQYPHEITLVAVGRLTNLALALRLNPSIAGLVKAVVIMGGALGTNEFTGNVTPCAEANVHGDPHAADIVFTTPWPVALVGLDVTMTCVMDSARQARIRKSAGEAGEFVFEISRMYDAFYRKHRGTDGFAVHDSCAVAYTIDPGLFVTRTGAMRVVTSGITRGQTILVPQDHQFPPSAWDDVPMNLGCVAINAEAVLDLYESTLVNGV